MKVALIHDYIKEYGGAERVLEVLSEIFSDAPIFTAFYDKKGTAYEHFKNKKLIPSWVQYFPFFSKLSSPLRFLTPLIWGSFDLSEYDIVISSASWYITKGFGSAKRNQKHPIEICYCHTPPRWLYGYNTSLNFQKYPIVRVYAGIVGHFMRLYDFKQAQKVNYFIANSQEVAGRIKKFYKRDSTVIYPPVCLPKSEKRKAKSEKNDYYFIVSRIVGAKGLDLAVEAALKAGLKLKIAGSSAGYSFELNKLKGKAQLRQGFDGQVEFLGQVTDEELVKLYKGAKAFLALSLDEDFGITPVEAMSFGTPVIAFNGGGYKESVLDKKTGLLFDDLSVDGLIKAIKQFNNLEIDPEDCIKQAEKFSKERFKKEIKEFVGSKVK
ncbi:MAG: glycosyltransferase [Candidatus Levybacteria bacterium]|nr:glycosyltransferase [Candidatus Levybacteria bacterium]